MTLQFSPQTRFERIQQSLTNGESVSAAKEIEAWQALQPKDAGALTAKAHLLRLRGRYSEALTTLERSLSVTTEFAPTHIELARLAAREGEFERANACYERAFQNSPQTAYSSKSSEWLDTWIELLLQLGLHARAVEVATGWCEARQDLARAWFLLGLAHHKNSSLQAALAAYQRALAIDAGNAMLHSNLSALHYQMQDDRASLRFAQQALRLDPDNALAWTNASNAWLRLRDPESALLTAERACALAPGYFVALLALSSALKELQRWDEAQAAVARAAQAAPRNPKALWAGAMLQLRRGDYANGFVNHEARWAGSPELEHISFLTPQTRWQGEDLHGKVLLIWGEQGLGDAIQFVRFVSVIAEHMRAVGGTLIYCCFRKLMPLFERSFAAHEITFVPHDATEIPAFDFDLPIGSLPLRLGVTLDTLPAPSRYLEADPIRVRRWGSKLSGDTAFKVGLVWSGSRSHQRNPLRSISPSLYAQALGGIPGTLFYSLQIDGAEDTKAIADGGVELIDHTASLDSFDETAALICNLDLVITVCTSVAHLSGALGVRTWLLLDVNPHWVWMLERPDSPWYPSVTLYRQEHYQDWSTVLRRLRRDLADLVAR
ncbi:tetratricopeptide repeat protein [Paraburkholderia sp. J12]|uniref:tetratricopeptide repeat protein n=1 Tax=Paraburkholderia sp. J12 TaxID=2805432 RepID=UPI002ABD7886|nr:tetratricopeptide repeat protein [Paraburkholderia sp. J12]